MHPALTKLQLQSLGEGEGGKKKKKNQLCQCQTWEHVSRKRKPICTIAPTAAGCWLTLLATLFAHPHTGLPVPHSVALCSCCWCSWAVHKGLFCSKYRLSQLREKMSCFLLGSQGCVNRARRLERQRLRDMAVLSSCALLSRYTGKSAGGTSRRGHGQLQPSTSQHPTPVSPSGTCRSPLWPSRAVKLVGICLPTSPGVLDPGLVAP